MPSMLSSSSNSGSQSSILNPSSFILHPSRFQELPLVGRAAEHSQLAAIFQLAGLGKTQVTAVIGETGIGKTRLVQAFLAWASLADSAADALQSRAFEVGGRLPYQPLVEALWARLDAENAPEELLTDVWLSELSQLLPELRDRYPNLPLPMSGDPDFVLVRIFEAMIALEADGAPAQVRFPRRRLPAERSDSGASVSRRAVRGSGRSLPNPLTIYCFRLPICLTNRTNHCILPVG
jgi:hypothetical protein